eukprot:Nk52_evm19s289 gene=Nk52_evmTU19s289
MQVLISFPRFTFLFLLILQPLQAASSNDNNPQPQVHSDSDTPKAHHFFTLLENSNQRLCGGDSSSSDKSSGEYHKYALTLFSEANCAFLSVDFFVNQCRNGIYTLKEEEKKDFDPYENLFTVAAEIINQTKDGIIKLLPRFQQRVLAGRPLAMRDYSRLYPLPFPVVIAAKTEQDSYHRGVSGKQKTGVTIRDWITELDWIINSDFSDDNSGMKYSAGDKQNIKNQRALVDYFYPKGLENPAVELKIQQPLVILSAVSFYDPPNVTLTGKTVNSYKIKTVKLLINGGRNDEHSVLTFALDEVTNDINNNKKDHFHFDPLPVTEGKLQTTTSGAKCEAKQHDPMFHYFIRNSDSSSSSSGRKFFTCKYCQSVEFQYALRISGLNGKKTKDDSQQHLFTSPSCVQTIKAPNSPWIIPNSHLQSSSGTTPRDLDVSSDADLLRLIKNAKMEVRYLGKKVVSSGLTVKAKSRTCVINHEMKTNTESPSPPYYSSSDNRHPALESCPDSDQIYTHPSGCNCNGDASSGGPEGGLCDPFTKECLSCPDGYFRHPLDAKQCLRCDWCRSRHRTSINASLYYPTSLENTDDVFNTNVKHPCNFFTGDCLACDRGQQHLVNDKPTVTELKKKEGGSVPDEVELPNSKRVECYPCADWMYGVGTRDAKTDKIVCTPCRCGHKDHYANAEQLKQYETEDSRLLKDPQEIKKRIDMFGKCVSQTGKCLECGAPKKTNSLIIVDPTNRLRCIGWGN